MSDYIGEVNNSYHDFSVYVDERTYEINLDVSSVEGYQIDSYLNIDETKELIKILQEAISQLTGSSQ